MTVPTIVGAYAAMPQTIADREDFYQRLGETGWVDGIEIPYRDGLDADPRWLAGQLRDRFAQCVVTAIPGTMGRLADDPNFGLASPDEEGRQRAMDWVTGLVSDVQSLHEMVGHRVVRFVEIHSAPSNHAEPTALKASLAELSGLFAGAGLTPVIEHCDAAGGVGPGEKEFLSLDDEITAASDSGVHLAINWGRSVVESHDPDLPARQAARLAGAGLLGAVMVSGAGPQATQYGPAWGDAHLPLRDDEPTSLLTTDRVRSFMDAAQGLQAYQGIKIQTPADATVEQRLTMITSIRDAMTSA
ncbi:DUF4862 family protein [Cutibacterium sp. WCA-380-WT-3A]|uniref:DUF4862 family protein n=1 Tax=Cutibacterium porci TaxID=2605781 RepID=A0A7K0J8E5_9ACTN|nr:DUF4862 family protein [Cutibacterium porci]MSS46232.1 DUF4862 family protein [Cutibacterium porci]